MCRLIQSVIILVIITNQTPASRFSDFVNHLYDYRLNWTPLSPIIKALLFPFLALISVGLLSPSTSVGSLPAQWLVIEPLLF